MSTSKTKTKSNKKLKLTTRGRYAVMAMVELAQRGESQPVPLADIARSGNISLSYLEQLFAGLRRNGLVKSYRGPGGGYVLAHPVNAIMVADILNSAEDCVPARRTANDDSAASFGNAETHALWEHIGGMLYMLLAHLTLQDVLDARLEDHPTTGKLQSLLG